MISPEDTPTEGYRGPQVCAIIGITYRQLDYWARKDLLRPSIVDAQGSGSQRVYSYRDLVELKVIKKLLDGGVSLQKARKAVEYLRANLGEELASAHLVIQGDSVLVQSEEQVIDLVRNGQTVLNLVPLTSLDGELRTAIAEVTAEAEAKAAAN